MNQPNPTLLDKQLLIAQLKFAGETTRVRIYESSVQCYLQQETMEVSVPKELLLKLVAQYGDDYDGIHNELYDYYHRTDYATTKPKTIRDESHHLDELTTYLKWHNGDNGYGHLGPQCDSNIDYDDGDFYPTDYDPYDDRLTFGSVLAELQELAQEQLNEEAAV
jgi:hypothetical protein